MIKIIKENQQYSLDLNHKRDGESMDAFIARGLEEGLAKPVKDIVYAIDVLCKNLSIDKSEGSYYHSWQANIAMAFKDQVSEYLGSQSLFDEAFGDESLHEIANNAAKRFLDQLIGMK